MRLGLGIGLSLSSSSGSAVIPDGAIIAATVQDTTAYSGTNTNMSGWVLAVTLKNLAANIGGTLDATKLTVTVSRPGYNTSAVSTPAAMTITGTKGMRRPVPKQWAAGLTLAAGDRICSAAKVSGLTRAYRVMNAGTTATTGPTHTTGDATPSADGISYRYLTAADTTGATAVTSPYNIRDYIEQVSGSDLIVYVALSDYIDSPDTISNVAIASGFYTGSAVSNVSTGITNSSTWVALKPDVAVTFMPWQLFTTTLSGGGITAAHPFGRNTSPIACVKYEIFDSAGVTTGLTQTVSAMALNTTMAAYNAFDEFPVSIDISSLSDGLYALRFTAYSWVGGTYSSATDGFGTLVPAITNTMTGNVAKAYPFRKDAAGTYGRAYAYIDEAATDDTTGVCSTTAATAAASPFKTIQGAMARAGNGMIAYSTAQFGRANIGNHVFRLKGDIANGFGATATGVAIGDVWAVIESDPALGSQINFTPSGTANNRQAAKRIKYSNIKFTATATPCIDNQASGTAGAFAYEQWTDTCNLIGGGSRCFQRQGLHYATNSILDAVSTMGAENTVTGMALIAGCNLKNASKACTLHALGNKFESSAVPGQVNFSRWGEVGGAGSVTGADNLFYMNNSWPSQLANVVAADFVINRGVTWVGNFVEATSTYAAGKGFQLDADTILIPIDHFFYGFNTSAGDGYNICYNETGSVRYQKTRVFTYYNAAQDRNSKQDWYDSATTVREERTGALAYHHLVGCHHNGIFAATSSAQDPRNIAGEHLETGTFLTGTSAYTDDKCRTSGGTTTGGGDYRPTTSSSLKNMVAAAAQHYPHTALGQTRKTDGTGAAGYAEGTW